MSLSRCEILVFLVFQIDATAVLGFKKKEKEKQKKAKNAKKPGRKSVDTTPVVTASVSEPPTKAKAVAIADSKRPTPAQVVQPSPAIQTQSAPAAVSKQKLEPSAVKITSTEILVERFRSLAVNVKSLPATQSKILKSSVGKCFEGIVADLSLGTDDGDSEKAEKKKEAARNTIKQHVLKIGAHYEQTNNSKADVPGTLRNAVSALGDFISQFEPLVSLNEAFAGHRGVRHIERSDECDTLSLTCSFSRSNLVAL